MEAVKPMSSKPWETYKVAAIYLPKSARADYLQAAVGHMVQRGDLRRVVYLHQSKPASFGVETACFALRNLSSKKGVQIVEAARLLRPDSLLVIDDVETIRNYPQSMTRNIIYHLIHRTAHKLIAGSDMVINGLDDLYSPYVVLDKKIIAANHYWAFAEEHRELSVFDGRSVVANKDPLYLAEKLTPFTLFDLEPSRAEQENLYHAMREITAPRPRLDNLEMLRA